MYCVKQRALQPNRPGARSGGSGERGDQTVAGPQILFCYKAGEEGIDLVQHRGALGGPVWDEVTVGGAVGADVAVRAGADESGWSRESAATTVVLISRDPGPG
ncbi:hypothetical protein GCM10022206_07180 [Streptomyces chiangmaiensis]